MPLAAWDHNRHRRVIALEVERYVEAVTGADFTRPGTASTGSCVSKRTASPGTRRRASVSARAAAADLLLLLYRRLPAATRFAYEGDLAVLVRGLDNSAL